METSGVLVILSFDLGSSYINVFSLSKFIDYV